MVYHRDYSFQSTPGNEAGRNAAPKQMANPPTKFQSTPGNEAGRNAMRTAAERRGRSFNPRPAMKPGETNRARSRRLIKAQ